MSILVVLVMLLSVVAVATSSTNGASVVPGARLPATVQGGVSPPAATCGQTPVPLRSAASYAALAGSTIASTGATALTGDLGLSPGTSVTGFPPGTVTGIQNVNNPLAAQAEANLTAAYNNATPASRANCVVTLTDGENLAGLTLTPGLYFSASTLNIEGGTLHLSGGGNPNGVFIFQIGSALTTTVGADVNLTDGAQAGNVFWQVGSSATLGTTSIMQGTILAADSITMNTGSTLYGRALASTGEVSFAGSTVVVPTTIFYTNYSVTFTETGLPVATHWSVTLNGIQNSSTTSTIRFSVFNGTYNYTVGTQAGYTALPSSGILMVHGATVQKMIAFSANVPKTFPVKFNETGLASGTSWSVTLNGVLNTSTTATVGFAVANGTYSYSVAAVVGHTATPASGNLTVHGAAIGKAIVFTTIVPTTFAVTFNESGLPSGTNWSVTFNGVFKSTTTTAIGFAVANGTYSYSVAAAGYTATPSSGSVTVHGAAIGKAIVFTAIVPTTFAVTFNESGLPSGTNWSVTFNGMSRSTITTAIGFAAANGTYPFSIGPPAGYTATPSSGNITVDGVALAPLIVFTTTVPHTYAVSFIESELAPGTIWSVTFNGIRNVSTTASIGFVAANGTFAYTVGSVAGFTAIPSSGTVTVSGSAVGVPIIFSPRTPSTFAITFTESGLASGTAWSVTLHGIEESTRATTIVFAEQNGTYAFTVGGASGYTGVPSAGNLTVDGTAVGVPITFTAGVPYTFAVTFTESGLAPGAAWSVTLNGVLESSTMGTIVFHSVNGTYAFSVGTIAGQTATPASGNLTLDGAAVGQTIEFASSVPGTYAVTFTESGLVTGVSWSVTLNLVLESSTSSTIVFESVNGTYAYSVGTVAQFTASPSSGIVPVRGAPAGVSITFAAIGGQMFAVAFTESGLPSGTSWSVTLNGTSEDSTTPIIGFVVANGSYGYSIGAVAGYSVAPSPGSITVNGAPVSQASTYTPSVPPAPSSPGTPGWVWAAFAITIVGGAIGFTVGTIQAARARPRP